MRARTVILAAVLLSASLSAQQARDKSLSIYVVDVEGGNATLFVAPGGGSVLIDTGNGGAAAARDADRIMAAVKDAGLTQIDHLITTHWHGDHFGAMAELARRVPIRHFVDHGPNVQPAAAADEFLQKVYPALPGRSEVELRLERARLLQGGRRSSRLRGGGTDFDSLRDYHPDDEFRRINWNATARAAKPITNLYREERDQQIVLLLDAGRTMAGTVAGLSRFEHALDAAIALAELAARSGDHVGVMAFASRVEAMLSPRGGRDQPRRALDLLFDQQPSLDPTDYRGAFATLLSRHRRRSLLVLFTELTEESVMQPLFDALPVLLPRHLLMIGSIVDPEVLALRSALPGSYEDAYLAAAAAQSFSARNHASAHLRSLGVSVEDREPGRLAGALADRYLQIKDAARL